MNIPLTKGPIYGPTTHYCHATPLCDEAEENMGSPVRVRTTPFTEPDEPQPRVRRVQEEAPDLGGIRRDEAQSERLSHWKRARTIALAAAVLLVGVLCR